MDIKAIIAYSSVAHMRLVLAGIFSIWIMGLIRGMVLIIAHGLCSSGLFWLANIYYERSLRRRFYINKGIISLLPRMTLFIFLFRVNNIAVLPSLNLCSSCEILREIVLNL